MFLWSTHETVGRIPGAYFESEDEGTIVLEDGANHPAPASLSNDDSDSDSESQELVAKNERAAPGAA